MKTFIATLAIVASIGTLLLTERVNGESIRILSTDETYAPGSALKWIAIFQDIRKQTDPEGLPYIDYWITQVEPVDVALRNGDLRGVATVFRNCLPAIRSLVPHLKDEKLQERLTALANNAEIVIPKLEMDGANMSSVSGFFESESKNLGDILRNLVKTVVNVVKTVLHNVIKG